MSTTAPRAASRRVRPSRQQATVFVLLTFGCTWAPWLLLLVTTGDPLANTTSTVLWVAGGYGPAIAAVLSAGLLEGRAGLRGLWDRVRRWRVGRWYLTLVLPLPVALVAVLVVVDVGPASLDIAGREHWMLLPVMLLGGILAGGFEEVGWRGYLLERLQPSLGPVVASVVIGLVWALWHAPLFWMDSVSQASFSPVWFTLHAVTLSLVLTWLYNGSGRSVLLAVLFHGAVNGTYEAIIGGVAPDTLDVFLAPAALAYALIAAVVLLRPSRRASEKGRWDQTAA